jgi:hypothetical protein
MSGVIIRGQSVDWPLSFWEDDAETIPLDCTGATLAIVHNSMGILVTAAFTDAPNGKGRIVMSSSETPKLKTGRFGTFRVKLSHPTLGDVVYPSADILVE